MAVKRIRDVLPKLEPSDLWEGRFDECLQDMALHSYDLVSLEQNAAIMIEEAAQPVIARKDRSGWKYVRTLQIGNATRDCFVIVPAGDEQLVYITKVPMLMQNAAEATKCHERDKEYALNKQQLNQAMSDCIPIPRNAHKLLTVFDDMGNPTNIDPSEKCYTYQNNILYVKCQDFGKEPITQYLFGDSAMQYGHLADFIGISRMQIGLSAYPVYRDEKGVTCPYARSVWFDGFETNSSISPRCGLGGQRWNSDVTTRLRGRLDLAEHIDVLISTKEEERLLKQMRIRGADGF